MAGTRLGVCVCVSGGAPPQPDVHPWAPPGPKGATHSGSAWRVERATCRGCGVIRFPPGARRNRPSPRREATQTCPTFVPQPPIAKAAPQPSPTQSEPSGAPALGTPSPSGDPLREEDSPEALKAAIAEAQEACCFGQNSAPERVAAPKRAQLEEASGSFKRGSRRTTPSAQGWCEGNKGHGIAPQSRKARPKRWKKGRRRQTKGSSMRP